MQGFHCLGLDRTRSSRPASATRLPKIRSPWTPAPGATGHWLLGVFWPAGSAPAALASQRAYFSTLRSHKSLEKHRESRLSYLFAHLHLFSSYSFSSTLLSSDLSLLSASALLCFSSVHIVGSLTSKLPSMISTWVT